MPITDDHIKATLGLTGLPELLLHLLVKPPVTTQQVSTKTLKSCELYLTRKISPRLLQ